MIYCIGDSFTAGDELSDRPPYFDPAGPYPVSQFAWPSILGKRLNQPVINWGRGGSSNTRIVKRTIDVVLDKDAEIVIIAWTDPLRIEIADDYSIFDVWSSRDPGRMAHKGSREILIKWLAANQTDEKINPWFYANWLRQVLLVQSFLKQHNQRYIMLCSYMANHLNQIYWQDFEKLFNNIDSKYFLGWPSYSMMDWTREATKGPNGHFLEEGHNLVANEVYEHIRNLGWVS